MSDSIAIIGAGGHGKVVGEIALLNQYKTIDFFDDQVNKIKKFPFKVLGTLNDLKDNLKNYDVFFVAIGDNQIRHDKMKWLIKEKVKIVSLIHPRATISRFSSLGVGTCVMANAAVNPGTLIKEGVIINTSSSIDHDCSIENYAHISPNCSLSGSVKIGKFTHLGTGTSVHPGINIGQNVKTGISSKIYRDIIDNKIFKN
jgi:sugar O-acyltransferase (sialic acid O-acetyltransferase NeuD family)